MPIRTFGTSPAILTAAVLAAAMSSTVQAGDCNCRGRSHQRAVYGPPAHMAPYHIGPPVAGPGFAAGDAAVPTPAPLPLTVHRAVSPPPGTLGVTYLQKSRQIPDEKHPRIGMVEIFGLPAGVKVKVPHMEGFRKPDGNSWVFESEKPLLPGVPHIYRIKAEMPALGTEDVRTVRLIPGRVVHVRF